MRKYKKNLTHLEEYIVGLGVIGDCISYLIGSFQSKEDANKYKEYVEEMVYQMKRNDINVFVDIIKVYPLKRNRNKRRK